MVDFLALRDWFRRVFYFEGLTTEALRAQRHTENRKSFFVILF
jgi:hypothetical protein